MPLPLHLFLQDYQVLAEFSRTRTDPIQQTGQVTSPGDFLALPKKGAGPGGDGYVALFKLHDHSLP